jgi:hypothetical protein
MKIQKNFSIHFLVPPYLNLPKHLLEIYLNLPENLLEIYLKWLMSMQLLGGVALPPILPGRYGPD